jgi:hypothetical protein
MTSADNGSRINLIMSGGGVRLSAYMGALAAFRIQANRVQTLPMNLSRADKEYPDASGPPPSPETTET